MKQGDMGETWSSGFRIGMQPEEGLETEGCIQMFHIQFSELIGKHFGKRILQDIL